MKRTITSPDSPVCVDAESKPEEFHASQAWRRKMALLEEIHSEISPQILIATREESFLPEIFQRLRP